MEFYVSPPGAQSAARRGAFFLAPDGWNDWWEFRTLYNLIYISELGVSHTIGPVKIGQFNMNQERPNLPFRFEQLSREFFSVGQTDDYYANLNELDNAAFRDFVLKGLNDFAYNTELLDLALGEEVTNKSLLRDLTEYTVRNKLFRMTRGGARLSRYEFYYLPPLNHDGSYPPSLEFTVVPESKPPTNIHVLIGRNGVGKTRLLQNMARSLTMSSDEDADLGVFQEHALSTQDRLFGSVVSISFSAFDPFVSWEPDSDVDYHYVGLKVATSNSDMNTTQLKNGEALAREFSESMEECHGHKRDRWLRAIGHLESDPVFRDADINRLVSTQQNVDAVEFVSPIELFDKLSSGHKIVLLSMTKLVQLVDERSLVLIDEPEAHLHPPLLSAFIRALSDLLVDRNGVAIIATHSPVVLQEAPSTCVWKIRRMGYEWIAERPKLETFGENVGVLTSEVFGLEVSDSGFHKLLRESVMSGQSYDEIVSSFNDELATEAKALVRSMIMLRRSRDV